MRDVECLDGIRRARADASTAACAGRRIEARQKRPAHARLHADRAFGADIAAGHAGDARFGKAVRSDAHAVRHLKRGLKNRFGASLSTGAAKGALACRRGKLHAAFADQKNVFWTGIRALSAARAGAHRLRGNARRVRGERAPLNMSRAAG